MRHGRLRGVRARHLIVIAPLAAPAPAEAATVSLGEPYSDYSSGPTVVFAAAAGERNAVSLTVAGDGSVTVRDTGAPVTARAPCQQVDANAARCAGSGEEAIDGASLALG